MEGKSDNNELMRGMGFWGVCALGIGAMVGAGVFVLTGMAAGEAGPALVLAFILNGLIAIIIGACYAELSTMIPKTGGAYVWAKPALGNCAGFFTGWFSWFAQTIACAFYATAFGSFFLSLLNTLGVLNLNNDHWIGQIGFGILISLILLGVNLKGSKNINFIQLIVTAIQVVIIFIFAAYGLHAIVGEPQESISHFDPFFPQGAMGVLAAMGLTFIAFEGYEIIVQKGKKAMQISLVLHEYIHDIIRKASIAVRDGTMDPEHPLYEAGTIKFYESRESMRGLDKIWSVYKDNPEEKICYEMQDYVENVMLNRLLPPPKPNHF